MTTQQDLGDKIIAKARSGQMNLSELRQYSTHESSYVRSSVAVSLGSISGKKAYALLEKLLEDKEELVRGDAIMSISRYDGCVPKLEDIYKTGTYQIKTRILNSLDCIGSQEAKDLLQKLKETENHPKLKTIIEGLLL